MSCWTEIIKRDILSWMIIYPRSTCAIRADTPGAVGESRLEGEDSRSRAARASARHHSVQNERMAIRSSNGGVSRQGTQSEGRARGSYWRRSFQLNLTPAGMGSNVSGEPHLLNGAKGRSEGEIPR